MGQIPFGALDMGLAGQTYRPLLDCYDVVYLHSVGHRGRRIATGRGVIVADPTLPADVSRRYPHLMDLLASEDELEAIRRSQPDALILAREDALKEHLLSAWQEAPYIHVAAHFVRDPEAPHLMFLPLALPREPSAPDAAYLDITDIRGADLAGCQLVVLSGCGSGAPYVSGGSCTPGLGDTFLDAGARAVIQTLWRVRDETASQLMQSFTRGWLIEGHSPSVALCRARRELSGAGDGYARPLTRGVADLGGPCLGRGASSQ